MFQLNIFSDVLALTKQETPVSPNKNGVVQIMARVLTGATPVDLVTPSGIDCGVLIYAAIVDQPITVYSENSERLTLDLGPESDNVGVAVSFSNGKMTYENVKKYTLLTDKSLEAMLNTQLRIALVLFWKHTSIAISLCAYVATLSTGQDSYSLLNTQAVALGQQLAGQVMAGPHMSYAPVLVLDRYKESTQNAMNAANAFEQQFERFQDKDESLKNQILAWSTMLSQATNEKNMRANLRDVALNKYNDARDTTATCERQFQADNYDLDLARVDFELGLQKWKDQQRLQSALQIILAAFTFFVGITTLCVGNPGGGPEAAKSVDSAVEAVEDAEVIAGQVGKILSADTLKKLAKCVDGLTKIYPLVDPIVQAVGRLELDPSTKIPSTGDVSGTAQGDADAAAIVTMAAWDKWVLEADDQMEFAVSQSIDGASAYRLALRKHSINGKQLAQAQAETVKAGYGYVQAQMEVILCKQQIQELQTLKEDYEGQEAIYAQAQSKFYDRAMALRTSVVIALRDMAWAYRYWALAQIGLNADSRYASDFQPFTYDIKSENLPADYGASMLKGIKSDNHTSSFSLLPQKDLCSVFNQGSHYRLDGLNPTLRGALPNPDAVVDDTVVVNLNITTSGIYADIQNGQVFYFASMPHVRRCSYDLDRNGKRGKTRVHPVFETKDHAEPTPFTQWEIMILNPEDLDLHQLEGIDLQWTGSARFD
ncbi:hypothetical protein BO78DRAFT_385023 [Aspergillus sclerotiicarbonarius CBS 121057]|uniref:Uncharacterized protein n=1 Tax=Aspergillus sclerotiicarbonarius (strain CBS 121057 / IBT 28362) TaxID=1448318 RepID=A0A319EEK4_ASPSB|nr:hypothetical protein BO78DRAFT_385023 [Aspergillus sclerotiicarbonarius CBS 121057]